MYIVKIKVSQKNNDTESETHYNGYDYHLLDFRVKVNNELTATAKAIDFYYLKYWTNTNWRADELNSEMEKFKKHLEELEEKTRLKNIPNSDVVIKEYEKSLRQELDCSDIPYGDFVEASIYDKLAYLSEVGCDLEYFAYPELFNTHELIDVPVYVPVESGHDNLVKGTIIYNFKTGEEDVITNYKDNQCATSSKGQKFHCSVHSLGGGWKAVNKIIK